MKADPLSPGKLLGLSVDALRVFLILAIHRKGHPPLSLQGYESSTPAGYAALAEGTNGDWKQPGDPYLVSIQELEQESSDYVPIPRRGPPILFVPGTADSPAERLRKSKDNLKIEGGRRCNFRLSSTTLDALAVIRETRQRKTAERLDDTMIVNALILEERERIRRRGTK